jgi:hypothetical protein
MNRGAAAEEVDSFGFGVPGSTAHTAGSYRATPS